MRVLDHLHRLDLRELPRWEIATVRFLQFVQGTWHQASRDKVIIRASGLAYSSLLAAVPLVVVGFSMFSAFGAFDEGPGESPLAGAAHFYDTYETADGRYVALAPLEPQFYRLLVERLELDLSGPDAFDDEPFENR